MFQSGVTMNLQLFAHATLIDPNGRYCAYLRKSRSDLEVEARGSEDTFAAHRRMLFELQKRLGITISKIYQEKPATSGERISERPEMIQLLEDVEDEQWDGVLVVEVERLARGDTKDQGTVAQAFKYSDTLIITPMRTYDPSNPDDEEYFEFGLFMSRREFKTINRRLQNGRRDGWNEGRFLGNIAPYGYMRKKLPGKGYTLEKHPEQAPVVELLFALYTHPDPEQRMGTAKIARYFNEILKIPTMKDAEWTVATLNGMLRNIYYMGKTGPKRRPQIRKKDGTKSRPRVKRDKSKEKNALWPPIVSEETFELAYSILSENKQLKVVTGRITNPLAGLVRCGVCGKAMVARPNPNNPTSLICSKRSGGQSCSNVSSYLDIVEAKILFGLGEWLKGYTAQWSKSEVSGTVEDETRLKALQSATGNMKKKVATLNTQKSKLHDLLEQGVYTIEVFMERSATLKIQVDELEGAILSSEKEIVEEQRRVSAKTEIVPKVKEVLELYPQTNDALVKNTLLKSVLSYVTYRKEVGGRWSGMEDQFELRLSPKIPE